MASNRISSDFGSCLLTGAAAFFFVPIFMIGSTPEEFYFLDFSVFFSAATALATLLAGALFGICVALRVCGLARIAQIFAAFVLWWVLIAGFFLPVSASSGMVDPKYNAIDPVNLAVVFLLAGIVCCIRFTIVKKYLNIFAAFVVLTSVLPAAIAIYSSDLTRTGVISTRHTSLDISNKRNILVISFDGLPGHIIGKVIRESSIFSEAFRDFTFFDNVISQSPATAASQIGELFGVVDFKAKSGDIKEVHNTLRLEGAVDALPFNQAEDSFAKGYPLLEGRIPALVQEQYETDTVDFLRYAIVRMWTRLPLQLVAWEDWTNPLRKLMELKPSTIDHRPSTIDHRPSTIDHRPWLGAWKNTMARLGTRTSF